MMPKGAKRERKGVPKVMILVQKSTLGRSRVILFNHFVCFLLVRKNDDFSMSVRGTKKRLNSALGASNGPNVRSEWSGCGGAGGEKGGLSEILIEDVIGDWI